MTYSLVFKHFTRRLSLLMNSIFHWYRWIFKHGRHGLNFRSFNLAIFGMRARCIFIFSLNRIEVKVIFEVKLFGRIFVGYMLIGVRFIDINLRMLSMSKCRLWIVKLLRMMWRHGSVRQGEVDICVIIEYYIFEIFQISLLLRWLLVVGFVHMWL